MGQFPFIQATAYHKGRVRDGDPTRARLICLHDMEAPNGPRTAENVAKFFARSNAKASAHFCVDQDSIVQCVSVNDTAFAAPNANSDGVHIELAGYARDSRQEWLGQDSLLDNGAQVAAECVVFMRLHGIRAKVRHLTLPEVYDAGGPSGFCGHVDVTNAFHTEGGHTDPGNQFPWGEWLKKVQLYVERYERMTGWKPRFK